MRNVLAVVPKGNAEMAAAAIRTIFAQPDADHVLEQHEVIATMLGKQLPLRGIHGPTDQEQRGGGGQA